MAAGEFPTTAAAPSRIDVVGSRDVEPLPRFDDDDDFFLRCPVLDGSFMVNLQWVSNKAGRECVKGKGR